MSYDLPARPSLDAEDLAAVIATAELVLRQERRVVIDRPPVWRFSGRWFNSGPYANRRPHFLN